MLVVHRSEHAAVLAEQLAEILAAPLEDPFTSDVVAVPAKGVERWLTQRLAGHLGSSGQSAQVGGDGVCANILFPSPRQMLDEAIVEQFSETATQLSMWAPARLSWTILAALEENLDADWCRMPRRYLEPAGAGPDEVPSRRLAFASRVARLFDSYAHSRPEMLAQWEADVFSLPDGSPISEPELWQPKLWRSALDLNGGASPVELHRRLIEDVSAHPDLIALPARVSVFGPSRVSRRDFETLHAIAHHRDVHLWLNHSSPSLWEAVAGSPIALRRADDVTPVSNPLLRSLSRDVRELQILARTYAPEHTSMHHLALKPDGNEDLLHRLRSDIALDRRPESPVVLGTTDRSIQVHACHGRVRQVEVLREVVIGLLADDPTLEPRDVLVMCPDIEMFAPLLTAMFAPRASADWTHPAQQLRVHIADRALHQSNPMLGALDVLPRHVVNV